MLCPKCQFENPDEMQFCGKCGEKLSTICPKCMFQNPSDFVFCGKCGIALKETSESTSIDYSEPRSYTPKFLADKILTSRSSIEGERKIVTVLFADVANFTAMSEKLDPEEVHQVMDGCFKILMDEIHRYEGTINQFTGDGVMALFGAPVAHEDHAQRGCRAALSIQKAMDEYSEKIERDCKFDFKLRIGLNSGPVIVGAIGDDLRMDYTAVGDTTNLAMRMESMAEPGSTLISEQTYRLIKEYFDCEDLGLVSVKGKEEPQQTYKLIKTSEVQTRIEASVSKGLVRFVGRKNSLASIQNAWDKAVNGSGQVLGVVGEAGVGKSRFLLEFRNTLISGTYSYFEGRCIHYGGSMAYLSFLDILKAFFGIDEDQREYLINKKIKEKLRALDAKLPLDSRPAFQDLLSLKIEEDTWLKLEPKIKRERIFEALRNLFVRLSEKKPLIIAVEDLHWMDKTSEEFLTYLIDSMAHNRILLILLYRPEYTHHWGSKSYYRKIGLDQLTMESSAELVSAILEGGEVASEQKELILKRSSGNPLFMEEFTHALLENGSIKKKENQFKLKRKIGDIKVPDTIQGIIAARIDRLEENLKRTMQVASVIGRDFAFRILQTITGMRKELKSYLRNLQGLEFIYEKSLFPEL
jgi:class 3 adenylate cyclase